jgi:hypothetical protein
MTPDHIILAEWLEGRWRIMHTARNEAGRQALAGEFMRLRSQSDPEIAVEVESFCRSLQAEWRRK